MTTSLSDMLQTRHSTRAFKPDPVPPEILEECLKLAQRSPSNSNLQPWRMIVTKGAARKRLENALMDAAKSGRKPVTEPIPQQFKHYRSEMGHELYGEHGYNIPRTDKESMEVAELRNYQFFDAPIGAVVSMDSSLAEIDVLCVGLWLQTLCLLLQERGISNCIEVSVAGYPDVVRKELGIPDHMTVLCGLAIGYEDDQANVNHIRTERDEYQVPIKFIEE